jgi:tetratricopeptide (TPR) repeat protein
MTGWQTAAAVLCVVTGTVFDSQHHPVPATKVYLQLAGEKELMVQTGAAGIYRFSVPCGVYTVHTEGEAAVTITAAKTTTVDLTLQPAFFDEAKFNAAGVADYTYRGGHGSDVVFRSAETLAKDTATLKGSGDPREVDLFNRGTELLNRHAAQDAVEVFTKGVSLFPQSVRMLLGLASAHYSAASYDESARWFYKATDLSPNDPQPYLFLGKVQARQITESSGFKERMARFAKLAPNNALANYYCGTTLSGDKARRLLEKAIKLDPQLAPAHLRLGIIAARAGNYPEAIHAYRSALEADPDLAEAHYRLSEAYRLTGDLAKAKEELLIFRRLSK